MPTDLYGNEIQQETPTTLILEKRKNGKLESDSHFKLGVHVFPDLSKVATVAFLRLLAHTVEMSKAERFRLNFTIEEVTEK
jgi:hypothetical protein